MVSAVQENYFDLAGLNKIKLQAKSDSKEALKSVASEFESVFLKMMLKSMRDANMGDELFDSDSAKFYREMYDDQLALKLSKEGGIGLASTLVKQLERYLPQESLKTDGELKTDDVNKKTNVMSARPKSQEVIKTPNEFIEQLMPHAETAAKEIGVTPKVLLAQAALETGWGKYVVQNKDGKSSHNLFNIKADNRWSGENASISTIEYIGNKPQTRQANFRVYDSYEESFKDYVKFLKESPRYSDALGNTHSAEAFTNSLQKAGYATDPQYAKKIQRILGDKPMNDALLNFQTIEQSKATNQVSF
ncbi:MAG: flagellar assembly peptidoglycan hydrolase FlgJ [Gammaproteobacteria bacterium]|nr:flagellar assembly peptidoglycan hydrolase FlgJ [Gammaproteobacteria bacterium]